MSRASNQISSLHEHINLKLLLKEHKHTINKYTISAGCKVTVKWYKSNKF